MASDVCSPASRKVPRDQANSATSEGSRANARARRSSLTAASSLSALLAVQAWPCHAQERSGSSSVARSKRAPAWAPPKRPAR